MSEAQPLHQEGESFPIQFVWQLPSGGYLRAVFAASVLGLDPAAEKYTIQLTELKAGREEDASGEPVPVDELDGFYWRLVDGLIGCKMDIAYEAGDGRPLHLRLATLTGDHTFFTRYDSPSPGNKDSSGKDATP